ncbi:YbgF: Tol-Pal system, periplasmic component [Desulfosarcina variabilis str. Montpellier]|jgi:tol-pal system protein YbgF
MRIPLSISLVAIVLLCSCAIQDDIYTMDHRLSALERRSLELEKQNREIEKRSQELIETKKKISSRVEGMDQNLRNDELALRGKYASLAADLETWRQETQLYSGRLEQMEYLLNQKLKGAEDNQLKNRDRMDRLAAEMADIKKRLAIVEGYLNLEGGGKTQKKKTPSPTPPASKKSSTSDQTLYAEAKKSYDQGNMEAARKGFGKLIATYPKSQQADNAQFWIGETYYNEKWYEKAILEYQKVIENYPSGNKIPAALLKQGLSFLNIGETNNARLLLKEVVEKYPSSNEAGIAKKKLNSL